jgi:hypothetical protein
MNIILHFRQGIEKCETSPVGILYAANLPISDASASLGLQNDRAQNLINKSLNAWGA